VFNKTVFLAELLKKEEVIEERISAKGIKVFEKVI